MKKLLVLVAALGCQSRSESGPVVPSAPSAPAAVAPAPPPTEAHEGCGGEGNGPLTHVEATTFIDSAGLQVVAAGARLAGVPAVPVADLLARSDEFAGKPVRLEGSVSAMCSHRRVWFAVQEGDRKESWVRVVATPSFLVPEGSVGKRVRVEGTVEVGEVDPGAARHYQESHKLAGAAAATRSILVRATGAEFY